MGVICWLVSVGILLVTGAYAQPLTLAAGGKSAYVIYRDAAAPPSVQLAAQELQRVIKLSTGAELPIVDAPADKMICLGDNAASQKLGLSVKDLKDDGFLIVTRNRSLYILGRENPGDQPPYRGYMARGTLLGSYDFLERAVGVRWLMPGEVGEDIPIHQSLTVLPLRLREEPDFQIRYLVDIQDGPPAAAKIPDLPREWCLRNKLQTTRDGRRIDHGHAWDQYIPKEEWMAHPEWLSKDAEGKPRNYGKYPWGVKYCTSTPEVVQRFGEGVIKWLDEHPTWKSASISPSDGGDFCECEKCRPQITQDPNGRPSYTNLILKFYNDVARIVAQKYPDRALAGYVYYSYMYPPAEPVTLEPNVWLAWAPLNYYGYGLLKPVYRDEFTKVAEGWLKITPHFVYHNYGDWMRSFNGGILPPARNLLALELPTLHRLGAYGADIVGHGAWGYGAPTNWIIARLEWDATQDVEKLRTEWLQRAYGPGAEPMAKLYDLVEQGFTRHKAQESPVYRGEMYEVNYAFAEDVYLPIFPEMERLYLAAMRRIEASPAGVDRDKRQRRLEMFGDNLIMLHWGMTRAGMTWPDAEKSTFYRTDEQYEKFMTDTEWAWWLYRDHGKRHVTPIWKGEWSG